MKLKIMVLAACLLAVAGNSYAGNLWQQFDGKTVKVFVADIKDSTTEHEVDAVALKKEIERALAERRSIRFQVVDAAADAEIVIDTNITEFVWSDHDPIDMVIGLGAAAADAAMVEDYARLQADVTVTNAKSKQLWKDRVLATITKKPMSNVESIPLVSENFAKSFIKFCFTKSKSGRN